MRNLVHIGESHFVVFLFPEKNQNIHKQANMAFKKILNNKGKEILKILSLEEAVHHIIKSLKPGRLLDQYHQFNLKYSIR